MTIGIWYYQANNPEAAERYLQVAAKTPDWRNSDGKQVLFLFLGNTAERRGAQQQRQGHRRTARQSFAAAVDYYQRALAIDHQYARAYYGIAETKFLQIDLRCSRGHSSREQLQQVVDDFQTASRATNKPILANIDAKIAFGLGRAYVCMTVAGVADRRDQAEEQLGVAIQALGHTRPDQPGSQRLREIVAEAHAQRGLLATTYAGMPDARAHYLRAVEDYKEAIRLSADRPERQKVFQAALTDIYELL
jgi:tetratricopeptide (TPR) repeat protein